MLDNKLFTFLKVIEMKSYTAAAEELHLTQPAVTQHIRKLEEHYGCKLIDFSGHSVRLTEAGKALYHYSNLQLSNEKQLINNINSIVKTLHVGATLSIADYYLQSILTKYIAHENCSFNVTVGNTEFLLERLMHGELDCAFIEGIFDTNLFEAYVFCQADFLPVVSSKHYLCKKTVSLQQLYDLPLVLREKGSGTRAILQNYLYQQNSSINSFKRIIEMGSFCMIKQMIKNSEAVTFMYENVAKNEVKQGELYFLNLERFSIRRSLHFVYLKNSISKEKYKQFYYSIVK